MTSKESKLPSAPSAAGETASETCGELIYKERCQRPKGHKEAHSYYWDLPRVPEPVPTEVLGTCADFPNTPHAKGTCESCDMWTPVAAPIAPAAVNEVEANELIRALMSARAMLRSVQRGATWTLTEVDDVIARIESSQTASAEGDGWIAAHRVAKALTNLIIACDKAQDWSGGTRVGDAIDEAEAILAELPAPPSGQGEVK